MSAKKPVIGILTYGRRDVAVENFLYDDYYASPSQYVDAVRRAGGVPVLLPPNEADLSDWLALVDGFVFTGGTDIDPRLYGGDSNHPNLLAVSVERDQTEMELIKRVMDDGTIPTLFICRGIQLLNVAYGGDLHEHIPDVQDPDIHRGDDGFWTVQPVVVDRSSKLFEVMGTDHVKTYSGHHQSVKTVANGLTVSAVAPDGIVEGLEIANHPFCIAVQWHPEVSAATDESQQRLFDGLVTSAS
ncbi:MAG: gamma-glutamyl-gamma-aminobutyrate hydrolase family protein [Amylibacter sp.]